MKVQIFPSFRVGLAVSGLYIGLIFTTLGLTPSIVLWLSGRGALLYTISFAFLAATAVVLYAAKRAGRLGSYKLWITALVIVGIYIMVSHYTLALSERLHLLVYSILGLFVFCVGRFKLEGFRLFLVSGTVTVFFGVVDEIVQHFLPNRFFAWGDIAINILGGISGLAIIYFALGDKGERCDA